MSQEAVIQFRYRLRPANTCWATLPLSKFNTLLTAAQQRDLLGRDPDRYDGLAFGNLSCRQAGSSSFWVTATQTADLPELTREHLVRIDSWSLAGNRVTASGTQPPSSETLAHVALHETTAGEGTITASNSERWILHGHAPLLWQRGPERGYPSTPSAAANGTVDLARAVQAHAATWSASGLLILGGHRDGVLAYAPTPKALLALLDRALEQVQQPG